MSVHWMRNDSIYGRLGEDLRGRPEDLLFGAPFPSDEVRAYWSMVPPDITITVLWAPSLGLFFVTRMRPPDAPGFDDEPQPDIRHQIMARDAHRLDAWMHVITYLVNYGAT